MIGKNGDKPFLFPSSFSGLAGFYFCEFSFTFVIFSVLSSILIFLSVLIDSNFWRSLKFDVFKKTSLSINFWSFFFKFDFITPKVSYKFFSLELNDVQSNVYETWFAADPSFAKEQYLNFIEKLRKTYDGVVEVGKFGANMVVESTDDGPVSLWLDSKEKNY